MITDKQVSTATRSTKLIKYYNVPVDWFVYSVYYLYLYMYMHELTENVREVGSAIPISSLSSDFLSPGFVFLLTVLSPQQSTKLLLVYSSKQNAVHTYHFSSAHTVTRYARLDILCQQSVGIPAGLAERDVCIGLVYVALF